jgi:hypothetical protein
MGRCNSCEGGLRSLISRKLGRCATCIQAALLGTVAGWASAAAVNLIWGDPIGLAVALVAAGSFTLLLISHALAFVVRRVLEPVEAVPISTGEDGAAQFRLERRAFLRGSLGVVTAGLLGSVFGARLLEGARPAQATACENPLIHDVSANVPPITTAPVLICAKNQADAEKAAGQPLAPSAKINADIFCLQFRCDPQQGKPRQCLRREGTGNLEYTVSCVEGGTLPAGQKCPKGQKVFTCTGTLTKIGCKCK